MCMPIVKARRVIDCLIKIADLPVLSLIILDEQRKPYNYPGTLSIDQIAVFLSYGYGQMTGDSCL